MDIYVAFPNCPIWNENHDMNLQAEYEIILAQSANFLCEKEINIGDLKRVLARYFASNKTVLQTLQTLAPYDGDFEHHLTRYPCDDQCCKGDMDMN